MQRQFNFLSNQRLDVPHLRMVESSVTNDFQTLAGQILAGGTPLVVKGFDLQTVGTIGGPAQSLLLNVAGGVLLHPMASEAGAIFKVPTTQAAEALTSANANVIGGFSVGTNYIGVDLVRSIDASTEDVVSFLSSSTQAEFKQTVPLARSLWYKIYVQTSDFDHSSNILPIAIVVVDANGNVSSITDARNMAFRLGVGGTSPSAVTPYFTPVPRTESAITINSVNPTVNPFTGCDKNFSSLRDWQAAVMYRIWELGGSTNWFSPSTRDDVVLTFDPTKTFTLTSTKNWYWDGTNFFWQGFRLFFAHGNGGSYNEITDSSNTGAPTATNTLIDGDCLYVDVDRANTRVLAGVGVTAPLVVAKAQYATLAAPTIPGSRFILAWRNLGKVYVSGQSQPADAASILVAGQFGTIPVTPSALFGGVQYYRISTDMAALGYGPVCPTVDLIGRVIGSGLTNEGTTPGILQVGLPVRDTSLDIGVFSTMRGMVSVGTADTGSIAAYGTVTMNAGGATVGDTVTINGVTFTCSATPTGNQYHSGTAGTAISSLITAINACNTIDANKVSWIKGVLYAEPHASIANATLITAVVPGVGSASTTNQPNTGNYITLASSTAGGTLPVISGATLLHGAAAGLNTGCGGYFYGVGAGDGIYVKGGATSYNAAEFVGVLGGILCTIPTNSTGNAVSASGGYQSFRDGDYGGAGLFVGGGVDYPNSDTGGGFGITATGGAGTTGALGGDGVDATGGGAVSGSAGHGIHGTGGSSSAGVNGVGVWASPASTAAGKRSAAHIDPQLVTIGNTVAGDVALQRETSAGDAKLVVAASSTQIDRYIPQTFVQTLEQNLTRTSPTQAIYQIPSHTLSIGSVVTVEAIVTQTGVGSLGTGVYVEISLGNSVVGRTMYSGGSDGANSTHYIRAVLTVREINGAGSVHAGSISSYYPAGGSCVPFNSCYEFTIDTTAAQNISILLGNAGALTLNDSYKISQAIITVT